MFPQTAASLIAGLLVIRSGLAQEAENIGGAKQLFIDSRIIDSLGSAERVFKQAVKTGPLLSASTAWETKRSLAYPTPSLATTRSMLSGGAGKMTSAALPAKK